MDLSSYPYPGGADFTIERYVPEQVVYKRRGEGGCSTLSMCGLLAGIVVVGIVLYTMKKQREEEGDMSFLPSSLSSGISGMKALFSKSDAHTKAEMHKTKNLTYCKSGDPSCKDVSKVSDSVLKRNDSAVKSFLEENDECFLMIFAPWCAHCHNAMPKFTSASKKSTVPFAIINAELVSPSLIQGEDSTFDVKHFPYILKREAKGESSKHTVFKDHPTEDNLVAASKKQSMDDMFSS